MFDHDLLVDLPASRDDEPPSLRADIADELADHLRCAFRREVFKDGDETAAEQRVLDRFGDPRKLARRLWWQAMWRMIMGQRILSGLQWLVSLSAVFLAGAVFWQQSQMWQEMRAARQEEAVQRQALTTALNQLQRQNQPASLPALGVMDVSVGIDDEKTAAEGPSTAGLSMDRGRDAVSLGPQLPDAVAHAESPLALDERMVSGTDDVRPGPPPDVVRGAERSPVVEEQMVPETDAVSFASPPAVVAAAAENPPVLSVKFVLEKADGPAVVPSGVELVGNGRVIIYRQAPAAPLPPAAYPGVTAEPEALEWVDAQAVCRSLQPGRYELTVTLADGQNSTRPVLIRDKKPNELTVLCPGPRPLATVLVTMPRLPDDLREAAIQWESQITAQPVLLDGVAWESPSTNSQQLSFDAKTGKAIKLFDSAKVTDLRNVKQEDCVVFLPEGPVGSFFSLCLRRDDSDIGRVEYPTQGPPDENKAYVPRTVEPGENRWTIELPEEFLNAARRSLARLKAANNPGMPPQAAPFSPSPFIPASGVEDLPPQDLPPPPQDLPPQSTTPPQLTVKLVQDKDNGPAADVSCVQMRSRKSQQLADQQGLPDQRRFVFQTLPPDHYHLTVQLSDGQECTRPVLIRDDKPHELTLTCPGPRKEVPISITAPPLPEELQKKKFRLEITVVPGTVEIGQTKWTAQNSPSQRIKFDRETGLPTTIEVNGDDFDLSELPAEERSVFLPVGTVNYWFSAARVLEAPSSVPVYGWPKGVRLKQTISADQKTWKLELPQEYLDELVTDAFGQNNSPYTTQ